MGDGATDRPAVAVVVPFFGDRREAETLLSRLATLSVRPDDRVLVADNTPEAVAANGPAPQGVDVLVTDVKRSAYAARNEAFEATEQEWVLLLDADCHPVEDIVDRFFEPRPGDDAGAVAGNVGGVPDQPGFTAAYARSRNHLDQEWNLTRHVYRPMAVTANLLVRRQAWAEVGGFSELVRSGADGDFCWRIAERGWRLEYRAEARAPHEHREGVRETLRKAARDGAANPWLARRWPGFPRRVGAGRQVVRAAAGVPIWLARGNPRRAAFKAFDVLWTMAADLGSLDGNAAPRQSDRVAATTTILCERFPEPGDARMAGLPAGTRVEALQRPLVEQDWAAARALDANIVEDDGLDDRLGALLHLAPRRPLGVGRALFARPREAFLVLAAAGRLSRSGGALDAPPELAGIASLLTTMTGGRERPAQRLGSARGRARRALPEWAKPPLRRLADAADPITVRRFRRRTGHHGPLPPRRLRADVGDPDPARFVKNGERLVDELAAAAAEAGVDLLTAPVVLDFACGCGRVLLPMRRRRGQAGELVGCDVHEPAIAWLGRHLGPGARAVRNEWTPPLPFPEGSFDAVYSYSLFTHLDADTQAAWLDDIARVLKPGGVALLTTHGAVAYERFRGGGMSGVGDDLLGRLRSHESLERERFVFEPYAPRENATAGLGGPYGLAFNLPDQVQRDWANWLRPVCHLGQAAQGWQDIHVLRKPSG